MNGAWMGAITAAAKDAASGATLLQWAVALGLGGLVAEALRSFVQRRKMGADYADVIAGTAVKLLEPLNKQIAALQEELAATKVELAATKNELTATKAELQSVREEAHALRATMRGE